MFIFKTMCCAANKAGFIKSENEMLPNPNEKVPNWGTGGVIACVLVN